MPYMNYSTYSTYRDYNHSLGEGANVKVNVLFESDLSSPLKVLPKSNLEIDSEEEFRMKCSVEGGGNVNVHGKEDVVLDAGFEIKGNSTLTVISKND